MAEMKTLNGHEIVDAKARKRLDDIEKNGGNGESENLRILITKVSGGTGESSHTAQAIYEADVAERVIEAIMDGYRYEYLGATHFAANGVCDEVTFYRTMVEADGGAYTETVKIFDDGTATVETVEADEIDAYTKEEVNQMVSAIPKFKVEVVTVHPTITEASLSTIYLVPSGNDDQNLYTEWICVEKDGVRTWEKLGTQHLDLTGYVTDEELSAAVESALTEAKESGAFKGDKGDKGDTGAQGATGATGPQGPAYVLTEDDKAQIVAQVIASLGGNPVFGYVDEDNNIIVQGNLADGTYSVKYEIENEDGTVTTVDIGDLVLDSNVYYSVTKNLTNCTLSNSATQVAKGTAYSATVTADSGYALDSVSVTMGGSAVSVSGGNINIASVTGDIVITAVASEAVVEPSYTNLLPLSVDANGNPFNGGTGWKTGWRLSMTTGGETAMDGYECTGFIPAKYGDIVRIKNIAYTDNDQENKDNIVFYNEEKEKMVTDGTSGQGLGYINVAQSELENGALKFTLDSDIFYKLTSTSGLAWIRIGSSSITNDSIITINQEIV